MRIVQLAGRRLATQFIERKRPRCSRGRPVVGVSKSLVVSSRSTRHQGTSLHPTQRSPEAAFSARRWEITFRLGIR